MCIFFRMYSMNDARRKRIQHKTEKFQIKLLILLEYYYCAPIVSSIRE